MLQQFVDETAAVLFGSFNSLMSFPNNSVQVHYCVSSFFLLQYLQNQTSLCELQSDIHALHQTFKRSKASTIASVGEDNIPRSSPQKPLQAVYSVVLLAGFFPRVLFAQFHLYNATASTLSISVVDTTPKGTAHMDE